MRLGTALLVLVPLGIARPAFAIDIGEFSTTVTIDVTADGSFKNQLTSCINREVRALGDVEIVESDAAWVIQGVAMQDRSQSGQVLGFSLSILILKPLQPEALELLFSPEYKEVTADAAAGFYSIYDHHLYGHSMDNLTETCQKVVANFDAEFIEPTRRDFRDLKKSMENK